MIQRPPQGANLLRTTVENKNNGIFMTGGYGRRTRLDPLSEGDEEAVDISLTARFTNAMSQLGVEQWAAQVVYMTASIDDILQGLMDGSLVGVSDGSFKDKRGTACWILET